MQDATCNEILKWLAAICIISWIGGIGWVYYEVKNEDTMSNHFGVPVSLQKNLIVLYYEDDRRTEIDYIFVNHDKFRLQLEKAKRDNIPVYVRIKERSVFGIPSGVK